MRQIVAAVCVVMAVGLAVAKSPVRHMHSTTLGVEYSALWRGQAITESDVMSREVVQLATLSYAPVQYVQFSVGVGVDKLAVDQFGSRSFEGNPGFSPAVGLSAYTPAFAAKVLRFGAGIDFLRLNSEDDYGYKYSGAILDPEFALMIHAGRPIDIDLGVRGHIISGTMERNATSSGSANSSGSFSNGENVRGFLRFSLTAPSGAYAQLNFDASPAIGTTMNKGPEEASIGFAIGVLITSDRESRKIMKTNSKYFPKYDEMKKRQDEMLKEIED